MLTDEIEFSHKFNALYLELRDKSEILKTCMVDIYKIRSYFARISTKGYYNFEKLFCSMNDSELTKILKRTPKRQGSFIDLYQYYKMHLEKCKRHLIIERFRQENSPIKGLYGFPLKKLSEHLALTESLQIVKETSDDTIFEVINSQS